MKNKIHELISSGMKLKSALLTFGLSKSSYFYKSNPRRPRPLIGKLVEALKSIDGYELVYGYRKVTHWLARQGMKFNPKAVYRHMKALKMLQPKKRKGIKPTSLPYSPPTASNQRWEADFTMVPAGIDGSAWAVGFIDCFDKEVLGDSFSDRCRADEAIEAFEKAIGARFPNGIPEGFILTLRADRGSQFIAKKFKESAKLFNVKLEFCGIQTPNDKPYIESFISKYKGEEVYRNEYANFSEAKAGWIKYINWYNITRLHQSLNYKTPVEIKEEQSEKLNLASSDKFKNEDVLNHCQHQDRSLNRFLWGKFETTSKSKTPNTEKSTKNAILEVDKEIDENHQLAESMSR